MDYQKQFNRIVRALNEIPFKNVYVEIETKTDKYIIEKHKETSVIGFRGGALSE